MKKQWNAQPLAAWGLTLVLCLTGGSMASEATTNKTSQDERRAWQHRVTTYARIMSQAQWTPVADGIPAHPRRRDRYFQAGKTYTGVPYSNGGHDGRNIGFDIYLKTFLAALENPDSVLYTRDMRGQRNNSAGYYGMVCSVYTSYALQTPIKFVSGGHLSPHRPGIRPVDPQSAQGAEVADVIHQAGHVAIVTGVTRDADGLVTHVCVEESWPPTTRTRNLSAARFEAYLTSKKAKLYRITDLGAWRGGDPDDFSFPNYEMDSATPTINRVLLLDRGDWVPYRKDETVRFNVMDRDNQGVSSLVIKCEGEVVETIELDGPGIVERAFSVCGDYTAHGAMEDGASSQACEFSVCALDSRPLPGEVTLNQPWTIEFRAENMKPICVRIQRGRVRRAPHPALYLIRLTDRDCAQGRVVVPTDVLLKAGEFRFWVEGENRYGRLRDRQTVIAVQ